MDTWWYLVGESRKGPYSLERVEHLLREKKITPQTLVWRDGLTEWVPAGSVSELAQATPPSPPEPPPRTARETLISLSPAGPWRRYFARSIDLFALSFLLGPLLGFALGSLSREFQMWAAHPSSSIGFGLMVVPVAMFAEWLIFAIFGNTLGKALLGVIVISTDARRVAPNQYFLRQLSVYWYGLGIGFPLVFLFTMLRQYRNLKSRGQTGYDLGRFNVKARPIGVLRTASAVLVFAVLMGIGLTLQVLDKAQERRYYSGFSWHNPVTGKSLAVPDGWVHDVQNNPDGQRVDVFTAPAHGAFVVLAEEEVVPSLSLQSYTGLWLKAVADDMTFIPPPNWTQIGARDSIIMSGHLTGLPEQTIKATLVKTDRRVWRVVLGLDKKRPIPYPVLALEQLLLGSVE